MNHFFRRILLSVWLTIMLAATLTFFLARLLPTSANGAPLYDTQLVATVRADLDDLLAAGVDAPGARLAERYALDYDKFLSIFVVGPDGADILGRDLPVPVMRLLEAGEGVLPAPIDQRLVVAGAADQAGYRVVGLRSGLLISQFMVRPGSRALLMTVMLTVSAAFSYLLARFIVLPVRHLRVAGHRVAAGDLSVRVAHTVAGRQDDIALLARDFDAMTERIERLLSTQRRLMRDVSHELRSPLARLQALNSLARQRFTGGDETQILDRMEAESERLNERIGDILAFARLDAQEAIRRQHTDLPDLLRAIVDDVLIEVGDEEKRVAYHGPERLTIDVDAALLHSAVENIVRNAVRFTAANTTIGLTLAAAGDTIRIAVEDRGPGVPEEALDQLFEPFFQVDESRSPRGTGSGVGLAIARRAIQLHGGTIRANNLAQGGLRVAIELPAT